MSDPVRFSALKWMARSPAHYRYYAQYGIEETLAMRLGSGCHAILFEQPFVVWDATNEKTGKKRNRSGAAWEEFEAEHAGKVILNVREHGEASRMADAIRSHNDARWLLFGEDVTHEQRVHWASLGRDRSCTPDARATQHIAELKTTRCAEPDRFCRDGLFRHYPAQLADQMDGVVASGLGRPSEAYIVAVESTPPHCITVMRLTEQALMQGRKSCRVWLERLIGCERDDYWPGYVESIVPFDVEAELELTFGADSDDESGPVVSASALKASVEEMDAAF